ncbi:ABC transporter permease, partial [Bacteroidota bacterium]
ILLYVINEFSYDKVHKNIDNLYRVLSYNIEGSDDSKMAINSSKLVPTIKNEIPEIARASRVNKIENYTFFVVLNGEYYRETSSIYKVDKDFFKMFSYDVKYGNPDFFFNEPNSIVINERISSKYFGEANPVGENIDIHFDTNITSYTVTGVIYNPPDNTIMKPDYLIDIDPLIPERARGWSSRGFGSFILIKKGSNPEMVEKKLMDIQAKHHPDSKYTYCLQKLKDIYLKSESIQYGNQEKGNMSLVLLFSGIAVLILIIACLNYIILSTTQSVTRAKEIAIRKVIGASRNILIKQILMESVFISVISLPLALVIAERMRPLVSELFGKSLPIDYVQNWQYIIGFICITIIVGIISGTYLSLYLSKLKVVQIFNKAGISNKRRSFMQKSLIIFQLITFVVLMVCTSIINKQVGFATTRDLGFNKEKLIDIKCNDQMVLDNYKIFKQELEKYSEINMVSGANTGLLSDGIIVNTVQTSEGSEKEIAMYYYIVNYDYLDALGMEIIDGRSFYADLSSGSDDPDSNERAIKELTENIPISSGGPVKPGEVLLNEAAVEELGYTDPIGKTVYTMEKNYEIIGIVKDFNSESLHNEVSPVLFLKNPEGKNLGQLIVRLENEYSEKIDNILKKSWNMFSEGKPIEYSQVTDMVNNMYKSEINLGKTINIFTILCIVISGLGLFGLSLFMARQKSKEIGVRKVNGARVKDVILLIVKQFVPVILIANVLAIPIALYIMNKWLENFEFKIQIDPFVFIIAAIISTLIVLLTLSLNAYRAAKINPVDSLRYE